MSCDREQGISVLLKAHATVPAPSELKAGSGFLYETSLSNELFEKNSYAVRRDLGS